MSHIGVLVTGANGQLGRALLDSAPAGWRCRGLTRDELDLGEPERIVRVIETLRPAILVNAAAYTQVDLAESDEARAFAINGKAVGVIALALGAYGGRLVQVSTDFVFDGQTTRPYEPGDRRRPLSVYGRSKALGEDLSGDDALVVRTGWLYGAEGTNFLRTMLSLMRDRREINVVADQIGAPTWVRHLARVLWRLVAENRSGIYHYSDAGVASWYDFAIAIAQEAAGIGLLERPVSVSPIATSQYPPAARRPPFSLLNSSKTLEACELSPVHWRVNLRCALRELAGSRQSSDSQANWE
jgi:dTDP-4-dehydrorhamnose reductase